MGTTGFVMTMIMAVLLSWSLMLLQCKMGAAAPSYSRKLLGMENDYSGGGNEPPPEDDYGFYRRQGDVPSPGLGH